MMTDSATLKSEVLSALAHANRIRIIEYLREGRKCACEIGPELQLEQSNLSRHMKLLIQAGIINSWKEGQKVMYEVVDNNIFKLLDTVSVVLKDRMKIRMEALET